MTMNRKHLAFLPDDLPLRLGPPIRLKPKVEVTPAPPFMVEALERIEDTCLNVSRKLPTGDLFRDTNYASGGIASRETDREVAERMRQLRVERLTEAELSKPQATHGSVSVVIDESTPIKPFDPAVAEQITEAAKQALKKTRRTLTSRGHLPKAATPAENRREHMESLARDYMHKAGVAAAKEIVRRWSPTGKLMGIPEDKIEDATWDFKAGLNV